METIPIREILAALAAHKRATPAMRLEAAATLASLDARDVWPDGTPLVRRNAARVQERKARGLGNFAV